MVARFVSVWEEGEVVKIKMMLGASSVVSLRVEVLTVMEMSVSVFRV
jgi:hypothetical protein